jgi:class 3 adenylate cyclase
VEGTAGERCALPRAPLERRVVRPSIAGVYIHATAVNNLLRQEALKEFSLPAQWTIKFAMAALASAAALAWSPPTAALALAGLLMLWLAAATWLFASAVVLPLVPSAAASVLALSLAITLRFVVADKDKKLLRKSFSFYLSPVLIEKMLASSKLPKLGGETRIVTLYRSDLAGFSSMSEKLQPDELVPLMNEYLTAMTDIIDRHGGFVDKYIGDAIDGVFGAPVDDPDHAANAVRAALAGQRQLRTLNEAGLVTLRGFKLRQRIGLHTGSALVGNIGSQQRFNYTAMGDTANLASRLEGANKFYGTSIIASEATMTLAKNAVIWRELDSVRVVGRKQPVAIFEPMAEAGMETPDQVTVCAAFAEGLRRWRAREFADAAEAFSRVADLDLPASLFRERALKLTQAPPAADWSAVRALESK